MAQKKDFDFLVVEPVVRVKKTKRTKRVSVTMKEMRKSSLRNPVRSTRTSKKTHKKRTAAAGMRPSQRMGRKASRKAMRGKQAQRPIERRYDYYSERCPSPLESEMCAHEHHMNCIRCGLIQFLIGLVTGVTMALAIARIVF